MTIRLRCVTALLLAVPSSLLAYSDPGSGLLLWQLLVAGFVGVLFQIRKITSWFKAWLNRKQPH